MDNGAALEEALNNIVGSLGEQNEQMSIRMSELERAVHIERESLREEINRNRQEVGRSEKRLKERTDEHMTRELVANDKRGGTEGVTLKSRHGEVKNSARAVSGSLDTKIDAMMERRTQAIMDRLDGLLSSKSGPKEGEPNSGGPSREPRVNFNEHQRRKTYGSTRGRGSSSGYATRGNTAWGPNSRANSTGTDRPLTNNQRKAHMRLGEVIPATGGMQARRGVMQVKQETLMVIRIAGMHRTQSLRQGVRTLKRDTQGMLRQWPQHLNP